MLSRFKAGVKFLFGQYAPDQTLKVLPDDRFLVSYPKSGNTWLRFLIANLLYPETPANFANIYALVPDPERTEKRTFDRMPRPRVIKNHYCFDPRFQKVVYIVRDPRDVAISQYHFQRKRGVIADDYSLTLYVERFIAGEVCPYGSWATNVASWLSTRERDPRFLLVRYEDLIDNPHRELTDIANFLGISANDSLIAQAVARSTADTMRKMEKAQAHLSGLTNNRKDLPFVRNAKAGGWRSELPNELVELIESAWSPLMRHLGYEVANEVSENKQFCLSAK